MTPKQMRSEYKRLTARRAEISSLLASVGHGARSREDALSAISGSFAKAFADFEKLAADALAGRPDYFLIPKGEIERAEAQRVPMVNLGNFRPDDFLRGLAQRDNKSTQSGTSIFPWLVIAAGPALEAQFSEIIRRMPDSYFGASEAERQAQERELKRELRDVDKRLQELRELWTEEVGEPLAEDS